VTLFLHADSGLISCSLSDSNQSLARQSVVVEIYLIVLMPDLPLKQVLCRGCHNADAACNFICVFDTVELVKVIGNHVHCKCGKILETAQNIESLLLQTTNRR